MSDYQIIVVGAGAAGLAAALELARAGNKVAILEARDRIGGRIFTRHDAASNAPVELGAEFIHGRPAEIWDILRRQKIPAWEGGGENWVAEKGELRPSDFFAEVDELMAKMNDREPDESFLHFIERCCREPRYEQAKNWARRYVTGFHAADPALVSVHSLVHGLRAQEQVDGDRTFHMESGYQSLVEYFRSELEKHAVPMFLNTVVERIRWGHGQVRIAARGLTPTFSAAKLVLTVPLGVLQSTPADEGHIQFNPELPKSKHDALRHLVMGKVIRITLCFRERFWDALHPSSRLPQKTLADLRFLLSSESPFPTWWTTAPRQFPIITGWAPFHCAETLAGKGNDVVTGTALHTLSHILPVSVQALSKLLSSAYTHDWQSDPFSRGAYSYVKVGGEGAQRELSRPIDDTLFFAGEATDFRGHNGTVHAAIHSGQRAAPELFRC